MQIPRSECWVKENYKTIYSLEVVRRESCHKTDLPVHLKPDLECIPVSGCLQGEVHDFTLCWRPISCLTRNRMSLSTGAIVCTLEPFGTKGTTCLGSFSSRCLFQFDFSGLFVNETPRKRYKSVSTNCVLAWCGLSLGLDVACDYREDWDSLFCVDGL